MGCVCVKPLPVDDSGEVSIEKEVNQGPSDLRGSQRTSRQRGNFQAKDRLENGDVRVGSIDKKGNGSGRVREVHFQKKNKNSEVVILENYPGLGYFPKAVEGEQVAAGWPSWLAAVAGEAINGWLPRRADTFAKLDKIGQGTYSSVYKARDLVQNKVVALKRVRFDNMDPESVKFMAREIINLRRLGHPNIIKLEGLITSKTSYSLYLVFEYMEHDLTGLASLPGVKFTEPQVKCYMQQLLSGLDHCHSRGVLHRDIKGSNLLIDDHGVLKLADFGLGSFFDQAQSVPLTSRVVTLWYRPPELLLGTTHYGVAVDLWSAGCILGELYFGKPIMPGRTEVEQLHKIFKLCGSPSEEYWRKLKLPHSTGFKPIQPYRRRIVETFKDYPAAAVGLIDTLLSMDPAHRGTAASALKNEFFTTQPLACDPSSLPKYPPSKEMDAKRRDEEARRRGAAGVKGARSEQEVKGRREPQAIPAPSATAELDGLPQRKQGNSYSKNQSELFNHHKEETASGFLIDPPRPAQAVKGPSRRVSYSGPLISGIGLTKAGKKYDDISDAATRVDLSRLSGLVASRISEDFRDRLGPSKPEAVNQVGRVSESFGEPLRSQDQKHSMQFSAGSCQVENRRFSTKEPIMPGHGYKANKIRFSGPLLAPSNNVEQMLKDHDRQIQEATRRARLEKARLNEVPIQGLQITANSMFVSSRGGA